MDDGRLLLVEKVQAAREAVRNRQLVGVPIERLAPSERPLGDVEAEDPGAALVGGAAGRHDERQSRSRVARSRAIGMS